MSPTNVVSSSTPTRSRLKSRKSSGVTKSPKSPAAKLSDKTTSLSLESPNQIIDGKGQVRNIPPKRGNQFVSPTRAEPSLYFDDSCSSPSHIPNSQAPIPGREVYWDHDTPESKRLREQYEREFQQMSPEAASAPIHTPTIKMVPRMRNISRPSAASANDGEYLLEDLRSFNNQVNERIERDRRLENNQNNGTSLTEGKYVTDSPRAGQVNLQGVNNNKVSTNLAVIDEDNDMFGEGEDMFNDDDEDLLLQATQAVEEEGGGETKPFTASSFIPEVNSMKLQCTPGVSNKENSYNFGQPRLAAVKNEGFDDVNDSFDDLISQIDEPTAELPPTRQITIEPSNKPSSVLYQAKPTSKPMMNNVYGKRSASPFNFKPSTLTSSSVSVAHTTKQSKLPHPRLESCKNDGFDSGNDSFDEAMSQVVLPASTSAFKHEDSVFDNTETSPVLKKAKMAFDFKSTKTSDSSNQSKTRNNSFVRKFNSFDSPPKEKKLIAKFRSDSEISKPKMCSKEEIERKRKEALARRNASLSQKKKN